MMDRKPWENRDSHREGFGGRRELKAATAASAVTVRASTATTVRVSVIVRVSTATTVTARRPVPAPALSVKAASRIAKTTASVRL